MIQFNLNSTSVTIQQHSYFVDKADITTLNKEHSHNSLLHKVKTYQSNQKTVFWGKIMRILVNKISTINILILPKKNT